MTDFLKSTPIAETVWDASDDKIDCKDEEIVRGFIYSITKRIQIKIKKTINEFNVSNDVDKLIMKQKHIYKSVNETLQYFTDTDDGFDDNICVIKWFLYSNVSLFFMKNVSAYFSLIQQNKDNIEFIKTQLINLDTFIGLYIDKEIYNANSEYVSVSF
jgi:hypothetical protein